jgi:hypothetical protein
MEKEEIDIPHIILEWSEWVEWNELKIDARQSKGVRVPPGVSGVYEAKYVETAELLTIGKASDLRMRVKQGLVKGKTPHSAGDRIRAGEDTSRIIVRWAVTEMPSAVEEELHRRYIKKFGGMPKYVGHT